MFTLTSKQQEDRLMKAVYPTGHKGLKDGADN